MVKGRWNPAPLEAHKSSLSWEAGVESAFPRAYRATSLADKNLEMKEIEYKDRRTNYLNISTGLTSVLLHALHFAGADR